MYVCSISCCFKGDIAVILICSIAIYGSAFPTPLKFVFTLPNLFVPSFSINTWYVHFADGLAKLRIQATLENEKTHYIYMCNRKLYTGAQNLLSSWWSRWTSIRSCQVDTTKWQQCLGEQMSFSKFPFPSPLLRFVASFFWCAVPNLIYALM